MACTSRMSICPARGVFNFTRISCGCKRNSQRASNPTRLGTCPARFTFAFRGAPVLQLCRPQQKAPIFPIAAAKPAPSLRTLRQPAVHDGTRHRLEHSSTRRRLFAMHGHVIARPPSHHVGGRGADGGWCWQARVHGRMARAPTCDGALCAVITSCFAACRRDECHCYTADKSAGDRPGF